MISPDLQQNYQNGNSVSGSVRLMYLIFFPLILLIFVVFASYVLMIAMPGDSFKGSVSNFTDDELILADSLLRDVSYMSDVIGPRNIQHYNALRKTTEFIDRRFADLGFYVHHQKYYASEREFVNLGVEILGSEEPKSIVVVGAHYDSDGSSPAANDNGSGVAALLALARSFATRSPKRTLRFVAFANEEMPFFQTSGMGSWVYAKSSREKNEDITAMLSLETLGYYSEETSSQRYPFPLRFFYPLRGNFIAFVGNTDSGKLVRRTLTSFRKSAQFPSEGAALPTKLPGVGWSDHWAFWQEGYQAIMVTDTAPFRYPYYHSTKDTSDKIDYKRLARVVKGLEKVIGDLVS